MEKILCTGILDTLKLLSAITEHDSASAILSAISSQIDTQCNSNARNVAPCVRTFTRRSIEKNYFRFYASTAKKKTEFC